MHTLFEIGVTNAISATVLAAIVWLVTRIWRHPALVQLLWVLVLLKLATPPIVAIPWPTYKGSPQLAPIETITRFAEQPTNHVESSTAASVDLVETDLHAFATSPAPPATVRQPSTAPDAVTLPTMAPTFENEMASLPTESVPEATLASPVPWTTFAIGTWLTGSVAYFLIASLRLVRFHRALRHASPAGDDLEQLACSVASSLGIRRAYHLRITTARLTPLVWPIGRPTIILSQPLVDELSRDELQTLLAHEFAHLRRKDHWVRWLELVATTLYWWHPVVWFARRAIGHAEERACDAWVVAAFPAAARDYASALFRTVEFASTPPQPAPILASRLTPGGDLQERIEHVMNATWTNRLSLPARLAILFVALAILPLSLRAVAADEEAASSPNAARETSSDEKPTDKQSQSATEPLVESISGQLQRDIADLNATSSQLLSEELTPAELSQKDAHLAQLRAQIISLRAQLDLLKSKVETGSKISADKAATSLPTTPDHPDPKPSPYSVQRSEHELEIERSLGTPLTVQFIEVPLSEVIDDLAHTADIDIHLDPLGLSQEGVKSDTPVTIELNNEVSLKSALNLILDPLHLTFAVEDEVLKITSRQVSEEAAHSAHPAGGDETAGPTKLTDEELAILREHVAFVEQQFKQADARFRTGSAMGSAERQALAAYELAIAQSELALAEGRRADAVAKLEDACKYAERARNSVQAAYGAGGVPQDLLLQAANNLADVKRKLLHLQRSVDKGTDSTGIEDKQLQAQRESPLDRIQSEDRKQGDNDLGRSAATLSHATDSIGVLKKIVQAKRHQLERTMELSEKGNVPESAVIGAKDELEISLERLQQAERMLEYHKLLVEQAEADYKVLEEANQRTAGAISQSDLRRKKFQVELERAKLRALAD